MALIELSAFFYGLDFGTKTCYRPDESVIIYISHFKNIYNYEQ